MIRARQGIIIGLCFTVLALSTIVWALLTTNGPVLHTAGIVADKQRNLLIFTTLLSLVVILPVFALTFFIIWRYRADNPKNKTTYKPEWDHHPLLETIWWGIPCAIIFTLAVITWQTSHSLDPYKALASDKSPLTIQVVSLPWKWLFIYPDQHVATVNYVRIPAKTPIEFQVTSDAPMNSFWIPALGSQIYAMAGMSTEVNLEANDVGTYRGSSANLSGKGFADMHFTVDSLSDKDFNAWVQKAQQSPLSLSAASYEKLALPGVQKQPTTYLLTKHDLYNAIIEKYVPAGQSAHGEY